MGASALQGGRCGRAEHALPGRRALCAAALAKGRPSDENNSPSVSAHTHKLSQITAVSILAWAAFACAEPSGEQLVQACQTALGKNFQGIEAAMCDWYVTPCPCNYVSTKLLAQGAWCLPSNINTRVVARLVVDSILKTAHENQQRAASELVIPLLREAYPCPQEQAFTD